MCDIEQIRDLIIKYHCRTDIFKELGWKYSGASCSKFNKIVKDYNLDISHFRNKSYLTAKEVQSKACPVCGTKIDIKVGASRIKTTCSKGCSNTYFRSGPKNHKYKLKDPTKARYVHSSKYRKLFNTNELYCNRCKYNEFTCAIQIHHIDEDRNNNSKDNLIPLCSNCHKALHNGKWKLKENYAKNI